MREHECYMREKIEQIDQKLDQVLIALKGNDLGNDGIFPRLKICEKKVSTLENFKLELTTKSGLLITAIATVLSSVMAIVVNYFSKS